MQTFSEPIREVSLAYAGQEMTKAGQRLLNATSATNKGWIYASKQFALGAKGIVHVFRKSKVNPGSIWKTVEEPILKIRNKIIEHIGG